MTTRSFYFPKNYKGSAAQFIQDYIIPTLPPIASLLSFDESLNRFIQEEKFFYIRKFGNFNSRGRIYNHIGVPFTVTDNEPAIWAFMQTYSDQSHSFNDYHLNSAFPIAFALRKDEKEYFNSKFKIGKGKRENEFSELGLKHCHILDCSPRNTSLASLSLQQRMVRLMSPINHFPFPSPRRYQMPNGDIGENSKFQDLIIALFIKQYYALGNSEDYFMNFLQRAGGRAVTKMEDFEIEYSQKVITQTKSILKSSIENPKSKTKSVSVVNDISINSIEINATRFIVKESTYKDLINSPKCNLRITVNPKNGKHPRGTYHIPNDVARKFIETKRVKYNWQVNKNFHQDGIPKELRSYFDHI